MRTPRSSSARAAATTLELAAIGSATFMLLIGLIVGAMGVFRFQEVAHLAREGARYASVHGYKYSSAGLPASTGVAEVTSSTQVRDYLLPKATLLNASNLTISTTWSVPSGYTPINVISYTDTNPSLVPPAQVVINNYVSVTVAYQWFPELYFFGPYNLTSTSTMQMSY